MDAMEVLTNLEQIQPYFQPVFSADEHIAVGYEILGRYVDDSGITSLGEFFEDESIPDEYRIEVDNVVLRQALEKCMGAEENALFFINRDPKLLMLDHGESFLKILKNRLGEEQLGRVVIVLPSKKLQGETEGIQHLLNYYRTYGIKIAVAHLDADSKLDSISTFSPNILKVNMEALRYQGWDVQKEFLEQLGRLARKMGAMLLFEKIETSYQLQIAWKNGGRYYEGDYLGGPEPNFIKADLLRNRFKQECHNFILAEKKAIEQRFSKKEELKMLIQENIQKIKPSCSDPLSLKMLAEALSDSSFRLYICNEDGFQTSPNIVRKNREWVTEPQCVGKNWSWRPYFLKTIIKMRNNQKGELSDPYSDIETGEIIRTYSIPLNQNEYIFVDISYAYLFEHDIF